ncbi:MAG: hypothetical protein MAG795_00993 [Candidatus Woesearchaeota archaeon]|nr:hypothetical protein [Candidatus Woesearchaeota archaeon]
MGFSKSFPRTVKGTTYPVWEEVYLTQEEEEKEEKKARKDNIRIMKECIDDSKELFGKKELKQYQTDLINVAIALFEKRASHTVYWKESRAKEKFDKLFGGK